jgi:5'-3' exonuclease
MTKFLHVDTMNTFFRCIHSATRGSDIEERVAFAIHATLQSIGAAWRDQKADHIIIHLEGRSWRKDFYKPYKADREVKRAATTELEQKESKAYFEAYSELIKFFDLHTNVTIMQNTKLEADDTVAGFIQLHPDDEHVICSSDSDFHQLLANNVTQYNGVARELHTITGIYDHKGKLVIDKKTKMPKTIPDPKFILFEKCMRGDPTDNIFSAYPGVRTKGSKNKVGLIEAFSDRDSKGYNWNNLMLQRWVDHNKVEHKVLDDYKRNCVLVDLSAQPDDIRAIIVATITEGAVAKNNAMVGAHFLKFCGAHNLVKLSDQAATYSAMLGAAYPVKVAV